MCERSIDWLPVTQPFSVTQSTEPHQPGLNLAFHICEFPTMDQKYSRSLKLNLNCVGPLMQSVDVEIKLALFKHQLFTVTKSLCCISKTNMTYINYISKRDNIEISKRKVNSSHTGESQQ